MANGTTDEGSVMTDWKSFIARFGFATAVAAGLMWFMATQIVLPMRDDQKAFMQSVMETNQQYAASHSAASAAMSQLTQVQQTQAATLSTLTDQQKQQTTILQQIRDDQRNGAWRDAKGAH